MIRPLYSYIPKTGRRWTGTTWTWLWYRLMVVHLHGWWLRPLQIGIGTWTLSWRASTQMLIIIIANYIRRWITTSIILSESKRELNLFYSNSIYFQFAEILTRSFKIGVLSPLSRFRCSSFKRSAFLHFARLFWNQTCGGQTIPIKRDKKN